MTWDNLKLSETNARYAVERSNKLLNKFELSNWQKKENKAKKMGMINFYVSHEKSFKKAIITQVLKVHDT